MEAGSTRLRKEPIAVPDSDSAEQEEPQHNSPEITTTARNIEDNANSTESQPIANPQTEGPATVERNEPREPSPTMQDGDDAMETPTTVEREQNAQQSNEAPTDTNVMGTSTTIEQGEGIQLNTDTTTDTTPVLDQSECTELTILDILEDE